MGMCSGQVGRSQGRHGDVVGDRSRSTVRTSVKRLAVRGEEGHSASGKS